MAKTKQKSGKSKSKMSKPTETPEQLYAQAITHLETSDPEAALNTAEKLLALLPPSNPSLALPALNLLGDINVELGQPGEARAYFLKAAAIDPDGSIPEALGGGAEKFLWLAQLCEQRNQQVPAEHVSIHDQIGQGPEGASEREMDGASGPETKIQEPRYGDDDDAPRSRGRERDQQPTRSRR